MASVINTNMASLYAQKNLSGAQNALSTSVERLSSGLRINRAKDDAAGLGISEKIKSQVTSLNQGLRNANDAISMVQTAEGSLSEVSSILQRMKELSVQARNDSLSTTQRSFISDELVALKNEINAIAERTTFNDLSLLKNALRTQVAVPAAADATKLVNGASVLDGIAVSNLTVKNTNAGTYSITTGTQAAIANQISDVSGRFAGDQANSTAEIDTITVTGTVAWNDGDTITANIAVNGGSTINVTYTVTDADETVSGVAGGLTVEANARSAYNIAKNLAAAINVKAQEVDGARIVARAEAGVIYIGAAETGTTFTTTASAVSTAGTVSTNSTLLKIGEEARRVMVNIDDAVEGNKFTLTIGDKEYSVVAGSGATSTAIATAVAQELRDLVNADYPALAAAPTAVANVGSYFDTLAGHNLGLADMSIRVNRLVDGATVTNQNSTVSPPSTTTTDLARTVTINDFDVLEGRKAVIRVGNPDFYSEFSTIIGADTTADELATTLDALTNQTFTTTVANNVITFGAADKLGMSTIEVFFVDMVEGERIASSSTVSAKAQDRNDRTITINQGDLSPGNVVSLMVDDKEYALKVRADDSASDVAQRLADLVSADYAGSVLAPTYSVTTAGVTGTTAEVVAVTFNANGMSKGDSITVAGLTFTASRALTQSEVAAAFSSVTGANVNGSTSPAQKYGVFTGSMSGWTSGVATTTGVTFTAATQDTNSNLSTDVKVRRAVSASANTITLGEGLELGNNNISLTVKQLTNPGKITITANADTGIGGTSQSIDVGTIAAGSSKSFDFDNLGVSFTLNNSRATAVNSASFEAYSSKVTSLSVESAMDGEALFQVGAGTRDNVVLDGFKDIRMTGQNKNVGAEKEVFDKVYETLTTISANTTESLSEANFATLENRIEDAITMVSDFRSYFGGQQNRIEFAIANIQAQSENLTAANSRIVDTDYAAETANLTKTQIMQQAATAMLAQANQMPNVILALLK